MWEFKSDCLLKDILVYVYDVTPVVPDSSTNFYNTYIHTS